MIADNFILIPSHSESLCSLAAFPFAISDVEVKILKVNKDLFILSRVDETSFFLAD